jgi:SAM-dependent methyltransferase
MSLKKILRSFAIEISRIPFVWNVVHAPAVKNVIHTLPGFRSLYSGWDRLHPFDRAHGTDTSGFASAKEMFPGESSSVCYSYGGSQPGVIRSVLAKLPPLETFAFIDLGCGKGRPLLVASEFPFRDIVGVELSPVLAEIARANAAILKRQFPERTPVRIEAGDACAYSLPPGDIVLFLYNPFGEELMWKVASRVEEALEAEHRSLYIIYFNPVFGECLDASPALRRYFAAKVPYAREERGYGPDAAEVVVVWQGGMLTQPHPGAEASIVVTRAREKVELVG